MSGTSAHETSPIASSDSSGGESADVAERYGPILLKPVQATAFWAGIGLPFLYLPLFISGPGSTAGWLTCLGLLALHVVTLVLGHSHRR